MTVRAPRTGACLDRVHDGCSIYCASVGGPRVGGRLFLSELPALAAGCVLGYFNILFISSSFDFTLAVNIHANADARHGAYSLSVHFATAVDSNIV